MNKFNVFSVKGVKLSEVSAPKEFEAKDNLALLAQAVRVYENGSHVGRSKVKTRAEIDRTKKKWYKQKGTGGARHGSRSAPIFVGGGIAHGPTGLQRQLSLPVKMAKRALEVSLAYKAKLGDVVLVKDLDKVTKTKEAQELLAKVTKAEEKNPTRFSVIVKDTNKIVEKFFGNIDNVKVVSYQNLNAYKVFLGGMLVFDASIFEVKESKVKETKAVKKVATKKVAKKGTK